MTTEIKLFSFVRLLFEKTLRIWPKYFSSDTVKKPNYYEFQSVTWPNKKVVVFVLPSSIILEQIANVMKRKQRFETLQIWPFERLCILSFSLCFISNEKRTVYNVVPPWLEASQKENCVLEVISTSWPFCRKTLRKDRERIFFLDFFCLNWANFICTKTVNLLSCVAIAFAEMVH